MNGITLNGEKLPAENITVRMDPGLQLVASYHFQLTHWDLDGVFAAFFESEVRILKWERFLARGHWLDTIPERKAT